MAHIEKKLGKWGLSYRFIVSAGFDCNGKRIFHKKTWKPPTEYDRETGGQSCKPGSGYF